ncbi:MAG: UDP-N-acetylmuramate--L-alanine ligase [Bacteroidia bacterium]|nr:UDP-N-acetylmuramate--L-alanine ligase [Bacteroidia bacterium]MDW8346815.1 UDP-N-acetylmuramate--L-alanine ligase [Bacteroidia bacterium]
MNIDLKNIKKAYFIGIGGIGMSALARYFKAQGVTVEGYDRTETNLTQQLNKEGIKVYHEVNTNHLTTDTDIFIYTPAVKPEENEELAYLIEQQAPLYKRAEVLGAIAKEYKCIAVAGTHGKTSTATIITHILNHCGVGASAFLGGISKNYGTNYIQGDSEWLIVEADEYDRSFLQLNPYISVITSIDPDHLDIYGTEEKVQQAYKQFLEKTNPEGAILYYENNPNLRKLITSIKKIPRVSYGVEDAADYTADNITYRNGKFTFDILKHGEDHRSNFKLNAFGWHNLINAMAGITLAEILGLDMNLVQEAALSYQGVERRFDVYIHPECTIIDDYAHHPEEIKKTLDSVKRMYPNRKIMAVFQPHLYSRTQYFYKGFAEALSLAHKVVLLPIYPAREQPIEGITSDLIFNEIKSVPKQLISYEDAPSYIYLKSKTYPVVVIMGAGDIDKVAQKVIQRYKNLPA